MENYVAEGVADRIQNAIRIKYHTDIPRLRNVGGDKSDWIDLYAAEDVVMAAGEWRLISLGVSMELPEGFEAHIVPRSSTFKKWGIIQANHVGIIDNSYSGDDDIWMFSAIAMNDTRINKGDRICQFRLVRKMDPVAFVETEQLKNENRGGFGSTGAR